MEKISNKGSFKKKGHGPSTQRTLQGKSIFGWTAGAGFSGLAGRGRQRAITLIELLFVVAIVGIMIAIGIPLYNSYVDRTRVAQAESDIASIGFLISHFQVANGVFPDSLADVGNSGAQDPWGRPYQYLNLTTMKGNGQVRKDKNMVPINSDFDLYSVGKDGKTKGPLTATASRDDIVRASNGRFIGLASDY